MLRAAVLMAVLAGLAVASAAMGAVHVPVWALATTGLDPVQHAVLVDIRLPRIGLAMLVGAGLGVAGALLQGLFRNPLADPGLVGVSSGAALAAAAAIVLGFPGGVSLPAAAFGGGVLATMTALALARRGGVLSVTHLLLAGVAVNALCGAGVGLLVFAASEEQLRGITFWTLGSLGGATWSNLGIAAFGAGLPVLGGLGLARWLDVLMLGETDARALGVPLDTLKGACVVLAALAVGTGVALCGIIGFVGLVAPHLVRLAVGPRHSRVLPGSALVGATLMLGADLLARTLVAPVELPVGVLTTLVGGPFLLWLLARSPS